MKIAFVKKRNEPGTDDFAAYLESPAGRYLGDLRPAGSAWRAHPAGEAEALPFTWPTRAEAGAALVRFAQTK